MMRRVQFLENDTVAEIESREDYTKREILNAFYTENELSKISHRCFEEAERWQDDLQSTVFLRGLEKFTDQGNKLSATNKERCLDAVMDEQDRQWAIEEDDYDRLAVVSQEASELSVALALKRGEEDEMEAQRIYQLILKQKIPKSKITVSKPIEDDEQTSACSDLS